jgi:hypothetical protein
MSEGPLMTNYDRGVFWGEIDRLAALPADAQDALKAAQQYANRDGRCTLPTGDDDFARGYADAYAGRINYAAGAAVEG